MDKVAIVKQQLKLNHWRNVINECQTSGMKVKDWISEHGISRDQYYYWLRKVREDYVKDLSVEPLPLSADSKHDAPTFKPLEVRTNIVPASTAAITIRLSQATVEVATGTDRQTVEAVLQALKSI